MELGKSKNLHSQTRLIPQELQSTRKSWQAFSHTPEQKYFLAEITAHNYSWYID